MADTMTIWSYSLQKGTLGAPLIAPLDTGDAQVVDLATARTSDWHVGYAACLGCDFFFIAMVQGKDLPPRLRCPRCAHSNVIPAQYWEAGCEARCTFCGNTWKVVYTCGRPDILPKRLRCQRCGSSTDRLVPWPLPC